MRQKLKVGRTKTGMKLFTGNSKVVSFFNNVGSLENPYSSDASVNVTFNY